MSNSWAHVEFELTDPQDAVLFAAGRTMEYYHGRDGDGAWSEGSGRAALHFMPSVSGTYTVTLDSVERGTWGGQARDATSVTVSARQGLSSGLYLFILTAVFLGIALALSLPGFLHERRRWAHGDWSDD